MGSILDIFLHLDTVLASIAAQYGSLAYGLLFAVIFFETGIVVTPFLPGDSLLFAAGALAAAGAFDVTLLFVLLFIAAVIGDSVNYAIGHSIGHALLERGSFLGLPMKRAHFDKARAFYEKHGGKAIVLARFVPIVRTFAPFVAGIGDMRYRSFLFYNVLGAFIWVALFVFGGYFFGNLPVVQERFHLVILAIIFVSVLPIVIEVIRDRLKKKHEPQGQ